MLSSVLHSQRAILVNIAIMRVFVRLRETLALHQEFADQLAELERKVEGQGTDIRSLFEAIRQWMSPPEPPEEPLKEMGFHVREEQAPYHVKRSKPRKRPSSNSATS